MKNKPFIIERTNKDGTYTVISRHETYEKAIDALRKIKSKVRHEVWSSKWINTDFGYAPIAWIN